MTRLGVAVRCGCSARDHLDVEYSLSGPGGLLLLPEKDRTSAVRRHIRGLASTFCLVRGLEWSVIGEIV